MSLGKDKVGIQTQKQYDKLVQFKNVSEYPKMQSRKKSGEKVLNQIKNETINHRVKNWTPKKSKLDLRTIQRNINVLLVAEGCFLPRKVSNCRPFCLSLQEMHHVSHFFDTRAGINLIWERLLFKVVSIIFLNRYRNKYHLRYFT